MRFLRLADDRVAGQPQPARPTLAGTQFADVVLDEVVGIGRRIGHKACNKRPEALVAKPEDARDIAQECIFMRVVVAVRDRDVE